MTSGMPFMAAAASAFLAQLRSMSHASMAVDW